MTKEELTLEVIRRLKVAYPLAECTLPVSYTHLTLPTNSRV